jgi:hypothetical protein
MGSAVPRQPGRVEAQGWVSRVEGLRIILVSGRGMSQSPPPAGRATHYYRVVRTSKSKKPLTRKGHGIELVIPKGWPRCWGLRKETPGGPAPGYREIREPGARLTGVIRKDRRPATGFPGCPDLGVLPF